MNTRMRRKSAKALLELYVGRLSYQKLSAIFLWGILLLQGISSVKFESKLKDLLPKQYAPIYVYSNPSPFEFATYDFSGSHSFVSTKFDYSKKYLAHDLVKSLKKHLPFTFKEKASFYIKPVLDISHKYNLDPWWVLSIIWTESHFNISSKSIVGAKGLMQLMPRTKKYLVNNYEINTNFVEYGLQIPYRRDVFNESLMEIELGVIYLKKLLKRFKHPKLATIAYNMGPTWTSRRLARKLPLGNKNIYLRKVSRVYRYLTRRL